MSTPSVGSSLSETSLPVRLILDPNSPQLKALPLCFRGPIQEMMAKGTKLQLSPCNRAYRVKHSKTSFSRSLMMTPSNEIHMLFSRYTRGNDRRLGIGEFKKHFVAVNLETFRLVKLCKARRDPRRPESNLREFALLDQIYRVVVSDSFFSKNSKGVTKDYWLEKLEDGDLLDAVEKHPEYFEDLENRIRMAFDMALPLTQLYDRGFVHRDVKPENYLYSVTEVDGNPYLRIRITDLGLVEKMNIPTKDLGGSALYLSPESIQQYFAYKKNVEVVLAKARIRESGYVARARDLQAVDRIIEEANIPPLDYVTVEHDGWGLGITLFGLFNSFLDPSFVKSAPLLIQYCNCKISNFRSVVNWLEESWVKNFDQTRQNWLQKPDNVFSLEYVIWQLLQIDPDLRWNAGDVENYIEENFELMLISKDLLSKIEKALEHLHRLKTMIKTKRGARKAAIAMQIQVHEDRLANLQKLI